MKVKQYVNELVTIVHNDNKDWSLKKVCDYIAGRNDDFEELGFSSRTIYNYLNEENRQLLDTRGRKKLQNNITEPKFESLQNNVLEESSIFNPPINEQEEDTEVPEWDLPEPKDLAESHGINEDDPTHINYLIYINKTKISHVKYWISYYEKEIRTSKQEIDRLKSKVKK